MAASDVDVLLLTKQDCAFCEDAKELLARLALEFPLSLATLDVASDGGRRMAVRAGIPFPPGIFLDGEAVSYGRPSEKRLRREIARRL